MRLRLYLVVVMLVAAGVVAAAWTYASLARLAFVESGYPVIVAKQELVDSCTVGTLALIGDSRPEAAIIPARLPISAANLGIGSMTPVETYYIARRLLRCPVPPRLVIYSHSLEAFQQIGPGLWQRAARFGLLHYDDLREIAATADTLHDGSVASVTTGDGLTGQARDLAYGFGFPSIFISSFIEGRAVGRLDSNRRLLETARLRRGHVVYPDHHGGPVAGADARVARFAPAPIETWYFDRTLAMLSAAGVSTLVLPLPIANETVSRADAAVLDDFARYLNEHAGQKPNVSVAGAHLAGWPDDDFVDGSHMNEAGAEAFSRLLAVCVQAWINTGLTTGCDFHAAG